jgi:hypothetical protein
MCFSGEGNERCIIDRYLIGAPAETSVMAIGEGNAIRGLVSPVQSGGAAVRHNHMGVHAQRSAPLLQRS